MSRVLRGVGSESGRRGGSPSTEGSISPPPGSPRRFFREGHRGHQRHRVPGPRRAALSQWFRCPPRPSRPFSIPKSSTGGDSLRRSGQKIAPTSGPISVSCPAGSILGGHRPDPPLPTLLSKVRVGTRDKANPYHKYPLDSAPLLWYNGGTRWVLPPVSLTIGARP